MQPKFTNFHNRGRDFVLLRHGPKSFLDEYKSTADEWGVDFSHYIPPERSFIQCPLCMETRTTFTFRNSVFVGTNTSGGVQTITYEIRCPNCLNYSLFACEDVSYHYD